MRERKKMSFLNSNECKPARRPPKQNDKPVNYNNRGSLRSKLQPENIPLLNDKLKKITHVWLIPHRSSPSFV